MEPVVGNIVGFGEVTMEVDSNIKANEYMVTDMYKLYTVNKDKLIKFNSCGSFLKKLNTWTTWLYCNIEVEHIHEEQC